MAEVITFNYWLTPPRAEKITKQLISDVERIVGENEGQPAFPPITQENGIHERSYEFKPGALVIKMLVEKPRYGPPQLKIRIHGTTYEGTALAFLSGFGQDDDNYGTLVEELKIMSAKYRQ